jgi:hypothetical protein
VTSNAQPRALAAAVARYGLARAVLVAAVAGVLLLVRVPLWVALLVALVAAMPLSMLLFPGLRRELNEALAVAGARRSAHRARLRAQLRGDDEAGTSETGGGAAGTPAAVPHGAGIDSGSAEAGQQAEPGGGADRPDQQHQAALPEHGDQGAASGTTEHRPDR